MKKPSTEVPSFVAVMVTIAVLASVAAETVNVADCLPAGTVTVDGPVTPEVFGVSWTACSVLVTTLSPTSPVALAPAVTVFGRIAIDAGD
jgi:hypothetical protein